MILFINWKKKQQSKATLEKIGGNNFHQMFTTTGNYSFQSLQMNFVPLFFAGLF